MRTFELSTLIHRPPAPIWDILVDFDRYHTWNSVVTSGRGSATPGTRLHLQLTQRQGNTRPFSPMVIAAYPHVRLTLAATVLQRALVYMEHHFILQPLQPDSTELIQRWLCTGLLVPMLWSQLVQGMRPFAQFGDDLKRLVEQSNAS